MSRIGASSLREDRACGPSDLSRCASQPEALVPLRVAALYVETNGCYFGLPGVDPWDEQRDARTYDGPHPVVAHPPCDRWHQLSAVNHKRWGFTINEDGGCFASALEAVRKWGGVLEHPAESRAFRFHHIPEPSREGWQRTIDGLWTAEVDQAAYGHRARKRTWLVYSGANPPPSLNWKATKGSHQIGLFDRKLPVMKKQEALETPPAFRDLLLSIAVSANQRGVWVCNDCGLEFRLCCCDSTAAAIADTHPKGGDAKQAPLVSGGGAGTAIAQPQTPITETS